MRATYAPAAATPAREAGQSCEASSLLAQKPTAFEVAGRRPVALQRCDAFVGRTTNWLYDHLRFVPRYTPLVLCDNLMLRDEFPELEAWVVGGERFFQRVWRRVAGQAVYPVDAWRLSARAPVVLHSHFGYVAAEDFAVRRHLETPWVVSFYGADVYLLGTQPEWRERYAKVLGDCTRALALGPSMAKSLTELGCPAAKIRIHPLGVDVQAIPYAPREFTPGGTLRVLFAGTFVEKKGLRYVIEGVALARRAGLRLELHIVGDRGGRPEEAWVRDEILELIRRLGLDDCVRQHSWVRFKDLLALALKCHVFAAPSVTASHGDAEGTPFVLQQMMATAMPVIATVHSDIPYIFGQHVSLLVPERDARGIADRLQRYAEVPETMTREGLALRERIRNAFNVRACAARLSDLYDGLRSGNGHP